MGNTLWRTVPVTTSASGLTLQQNGFRTLTVLGQGTEDSCLTLNETNYLEQGGVIGIEKALGDATISIYDPDERLIVQDGRAPPWDRIKNGLSFGRTLPARQFRA
jgi:hypothetical protein